jgi:protein-disulfide isomerase
MALSAIISFGLGYSFRGTRLTAEAPTAKTAANDKNPNAPAAPPADKTVYRVPVGNSPATGADDALVTVVIFSDFQCPFCSRVEPTLKTLQDDYKGKIRFVWKNNPLPFHQNAGPAAEAAMAAADQGKFWEMHDKLFADQQNLDRATFEKYAQALGLDMAKFKASLDANAHKNVIEEDKTLASSLGANGTPSFFINGRPLRGAQPLPQFKAVIDEEVGKAEALVRQGTKKTDVYAELTKNGLAKAEAQKPQQPAAPAGRRKIEFAKDDPQTGGKNPKVTIVEFSDFQCPFCSRAEGTVKQILTTYKDDVKVVYKENPLPFHNNATNAAEAAMAAHEQGKFWPMHDKMFANQTALDRPALEKYAQEIGLNMQKFKAALDASKFKARIDDDIKLANANGAGGTPAFFINGKLISGAQPFENFKTAIDAEITHADELLKKGVKRENLYAELMKEASAAPPAAAPAAANEEDSKPANVAIGDSPVKGDAKAPITIVEFSDYQCPFCGRVEGTLTQVMNDYKGKVKLTFKNQPLPFHNNAMLAAQASLAAKEQGKFWEMHDKMFANQQALTRDNLLSYAKELGLDTGKFEKDLDSQKVKDAIAKDQGEAQKANANGTPTFFINGHRVVGAVPAENFKTVIDEELKKSGKGS